MSGWYILFAVALVLWNTFISFMNARVVGMTWAERESHGPFMFLVIWSAAIQSAIGFSMLLIILEAVLLNLVHPMSAKFNQALLGMWYLAIIVPALGTGLIITIHSWIEMFREKSFANMATTAYNTYAMGSNIYHASSGIGDAFGKVSDFFKSDDDKDRGMAPILIALVFLAIAGGAFLTYGIANHYRGKLPAPDAQRQMA